MTDRHFGQVYVVKTRTVGSSVLSSRIQVWKSLPTLLARQTTESQEYHSTYFSKHQENNFCHFDE